LRTDIKETPGALQEAGATMLTRETVREWLINFQHAEVMKRYQDLEHGDRFRELFTDYMYPSYANREAYESRNEMFRWVAAAQKSGKLDRLLGAAQFFVRRYLDILKGEKDLFPNIYNVVETYDLAVKIDECMIDFLHERARSMDDLNRENYRRAYENCSTWDQRLLQIESLVESGEYAKSIIEKGGLVDFVIERIPQIPLMSRNRFVRALNEAIKMIKAAYRTFKASREHLDYIRDTIRAREIAYVESMLGPMPESAKLAGDISGNEKDKS